MLQRNEISPRNGNRPRTKNVKKFALFIKNVINFAQKAEDVKNFAKEMTNVYKLAQIVKEHPKSRRFGSHCSRQIACVAVF